MRTEYTPPQIDKSAFHCPICNAYSSFHWQQLYSGQSWIPFKTARCSHCDKYTLWIDEEGYGEQRMIYPEVSNAPAPNVDLPEECVNDYVEAQLIAEKSPRGAAALLRLCIQKLCVHLGGKGKNINDDIAVLVKNGLPVKIQQALDVVRVVGNNAVHPGELAVEDNPRVVFALFGLINLIVENQISQPKHVADLFGALPEGAKDAVSKRDNNA